MDAEVRARWTAMSRSMDNPTKGRPVSELIKTKEILRGYESQRLRTYCTSECMIPKRDLCEYGQVLIYGDLDIVKMDFLTRGIDQAAAAKEIYSLRWGPTQVPVYNLLALFTILNPPLRTAYINIARFLIEEAKVPMDGTDLSGTTALSHCFSTKPGLDFEYAQLLYDAGGDVNNRNRYGTVTVRGMLSATILKRNIPEFIEMLEKEDGRRAAKGKACCKLCGREDKKLLLCGRCKKVTYCQPPGRMCQKTDWPNHKECKP